MTIKNVTNRYKQSEIHVKMEGVDHLNVLKMNRRHGKIKKFSRRGLLFKNVVGECADIEKGLL